MRGRPKATTVSSHLHFGVEGGIGYDHHLEPPFLAMTKRLALAVSHRGKVSLVVVRQIFMDFMATSCVQLAQLRQSIDIAEVKQNLFRDSHTTCVIAQLIAKVMEAT